MCKKTTTACFSGYRPEKFSFPLNMGSPQFAVLQDQIEAAIVKAAENSYTTFICGMAYENKKQMESWF